MPGAKDDKPMWGGAIQSTSGGTAKRYLWSTGLVTPGRIRKVMVEKNAFRWKSVGVRLPDLEIAPSRRKGLGSIRWCELKGLCLVGSLSRSAARDELGMKKRKVCDDEVTERLESATYIPGHFVLLAVQEGEGRGRATVKLVEHRRR